MVTKRYIFEEIEKCEMCGDPTAKHKVLGQRLNTSQGARPGKKTGITVSVKSAAIANLFTPHPCRCPMI